MFITKLFRRKPLHRRIISRGRKIARNKNVQRRAIQVAVAVLCMIPLNWFRKLGKAARLRREHGDQDMVDKAARKPWYVILREKHAARSARTQSPPAN